MSLSVKNAKQPDNDNACSQRQFHGSGDQDTQCKYRNGDASLAEGKGCTRNSHRATQRHHAYKSERYSPDEAPTHLGRPYPDGHHGKEMIRPTYRMGDA